MSTAFKVKTWSCSDIVLSIYYFHSSRPYRLYWGLQFQLIFHLLFFLNWLLLSTDFTALTISTTSLWHWQLQDLHQWKLFPNHGKLSVDHAVVCKFKAEASVHNDPTLKHHSSMNCNLQFDVWVEHNNNLTLTLYFVNS